MEIIGLVGDGFNYDNLPNDFVVTFKSFRKEILEEDVFHFERKIFVDQNVKICRVKDITTPK